MHYFLQEPLKKKSKIILFFYKISVGLQVPFKEIELKASGQDKNYQTLIIAPPVQL